MLQISKSICHKEYATATGVDVLLKIRERVENIADNSHCDWWVTIAVICDGAAAYGVHRLLMVTKNVKFY
jgi:hypothetical protein